MSVSINGTNGLTFGDGSAQNTGGYTGFRNRIINGAMMIDQRNAGASVALTGGVFAVDRTQTQFSTITGTTQRSSVAPSGFTNSLLVSVTTGASITSGFLARAFQVIEGYNCSDLAWGTSGAQTVTLSFWVRSSLTGTFAGGIYNGAANRSYVFTYTINSANTWEQKSITIPGDTSGTWATDNTAGMYVNWDLGTGSTYQTTAGSWGAGAFWATSSSVKLAATSGATFYITGVQLEKGSVATPFENRPYGTELQLCQRYYTTSFQNGAAPSSPNSLTVAQTGMYMVNSAATTEGAASAAFIVKMRTAPTVTIYAPLTNPSAGLIRQASNGVTVSASANHIGESSFVPQGGLASTAYQFGYTASAEL